MCRRRRGAGGASRPFTTIAVCAALCWSAAASADDAGREGTVHRVTVDDLQIEIRIGGNLRRPGGALDAAEMAELFRLSAPRPIRGSMLPTMAQLKSLSIEPAVRALVAELDSPQWSVREEAAEQLRVLRVAEDQLLAVIAQDGSRGELTAEQWHRLLDIVYDRLIEAPRGALGIRMDRRWDGLPGVLVTDLLPGMPAERQLMLGDRIIEIAGRPVMSSDDLIELVQLRRPGDEITMRVARARRDEDGRELAGRHGQPLFDEIEVDLELGDADQLDRYSDPSMPMNMPAVRGAIPGSNAVSRLRADQAAEARARFSMPPTTVQISGPRPTNDMSLLPAPEDHEVITQIRLYRDLLEDGRITASPAMRRAWDATLRMLEDRAVDPALPEAIRVHYREVARRYAELIPDS